MARKLADSSTDQRSASATNKSTDERSSDAGRADKGALDRRAYLRLSGAAIAGATVAAAAGTVPTASAATEREGIEFDRTVDAVEDLGLDPTGNESVVSGLNSVSSGTLVQFPAGEYLFDGEVNIGSGTYGFESVGGERATIVVGQGNNDWLLNGHGMPGLYFKGFFVDQTAPETVGCFRLIGDQVHIEDIEFIGRADIWESRSENMLNCAIEDSDGYGEVRNVVHTKGHWARYGPGAGGRIGIYTGARHEGTLKIVDCDLREFGNNALYCSRNYGQVQVEDSYFENNNAAQIRIGGAGSYADNCTIITDPDSYTGPRTYEDSSFHHRAIVIEDRFDTGSIDYQKPAGAEIRNCTIRIEDNPANGAAIHRYGNGRAMRVENTVIEYNNDNYPAAVMVDVGGFGINPDAEPPRGVEFIDTVVYGTGDVETAIAIEGSDESVLDNCIVHLEDGSQDGITITDSEGCAITDSILSVPGRATVFHNADVDTVNVGHEIPDEFDPVVDDSNDNPEDGGEEGGSGEVMHDFRIVADEDAEAFDYSFTVDGDVELVTSGDYSASPEGETITENEDGTLTVDGVVAGYAGDDARWGGDTFRFTGDIISFSKAGPATLYLDGEPIEADELVGDEDNDDESDSNDQLRIIAADDASAFEYKFTVDGSVELVTEGDYPASPDGETIISTGDEGTMVTGVVAGWDGESKRWGGDTFAIDGELTTFEKNGPAVVVLNGEVIDVDEYTSTGMRYLTIRSAVDTDEVQYEFCVDGSVTQAHTGSVLDAGETSVDVIETFSDGTTGRISVAGSIGGGTWVSYEINGPIKSMSLDDGGSIILDDEEVDPGVYGLPNQLTIVGLGEVSSYKVTVDGELTCDPNGSTDAADDISGSSAEGAITNGIASFRFDGDVVDFDLDGTAGVFLNGRQVDPEKLGVTSSPYLDNTVFVKSDGSPTEYLIEVSGTIQPAPDIGTGKAVDETNRSFVRGTVTSCKDGYRFSGDIVTLKIWGNVVVTFAT